MNPLCFIIIPFFLYKFVQFFFVCKVNYIGLSRDWQVSISYYFLSCFVMMIVSPSIVFTTQVVRDFGKYQREIGAIIIGNETKPAYSCSINCPDLKFTRSDACGIMASRGEEGTCVGGVHCTKKSIFEREASVLSEDNNSSFNDTEDPDKVIGGFSGGSSSRCSSYENVICQVSCIHSFNLILNVSYVVDNKTYTGQAIGSNCEGSLDACNIFWQEQEELQAGQIFWGYYNPVNNGDFTEKKKKYAMKRLIIIGSIELFLLVIFPIIIIGAKNAVIDKPEITKVEKIEIADAPVIVEIPKS